MLSTSYNKFPSTEEGGLFVSSSADLISNGKTLIEFRLNSTRVEFFPNQILELYYGDGGVIKGAYAQSKSGKRYIRVSRLDDISSALSFDENTPLNVYYSPTPEIGDGILTKRDLVSIKPTEDYVDDNGEVMLGAPGLVFPEDLKKINNISSEQKIGEFSIAELMVGSFVLTYHSPKEAVEFNTHLSHPLLDINFNINVGNVNDRVYRIGCDKWSVHTSISDLKISTKLMKIEKTGGGEWCYVLSIKLLEVPDVFKTNPKKIAVFTKVSTSDLNRFDINVPAEYSIPRGTYVFDGLEFTRNTLYWDNNGIVSVKNNESVLLEEFSNLLSLTGGNYYYINDDPNATIWRQLPAKGDFHLQVKKLEDKFLQYLYQEDKAKNIIRIYSRIVEGGAASAWVEYPTTMSSVKAKDIEQDANNRFITDAERTKWNKIGDLSLHWKDPVSGFADLPSVATHGEVRLVLTSTGGNNSGLYVRDNSENKWKELISTRFSGTNKTDGFELSVNDKIVNIPVVSSYDNGLLQNDVVLADYKAHFETNLDFTIQNAGEDTYGTYEKQLNSAFCLVSTNGSLKDGLENILMGDKDSEVKVSVDNIDNTLYTVYDNKNMFSGIVSNRSFKITCPKYINGKVATPAGKTYKIVDEEGNLADHTLVELTLLKGKTYFVNKIGNIITFYVIK